MEKIIQKNFSLHICRHRQENVQTAQEATFIPLFLNSGLQPLHLLTCTGAKKSSK